MKPNLVICDIDGTLINDNYEFTKPTHDFIEKIHEDGIMFGLASGRPVIDLFPIKEQWGLSFDLDVIIGMNGGELYDAHNNKTYEYHKLDKKYIKEIVLLMKQFDCSCFAYRGKDKLVENNNELFRKASLTPDMDAIVVKDSSEFWKQDLFKILFRFDKPEETDEAMNILETMKFTNYQCFRTKPTMIEFQDVRVSKATTLIEYCEISNINISDVIACGDTTNDNGMLKAAGIGVCLKNGTEDTKSCANIITEKTNNENGLVQCLEKLIYEFNIDK